MSLCSETHLKFQNFYSNVSIYILYFRISGWGAQLLSPKTHQKAFYVQQWGSMNLFRRLSTNKTLCDFHRTADVNSVAQ